MTTTALTFAAAYARRYGPWQTLPHGFRNWSYRTHRTILISSLALKARAERVGDPGASNLPTASIARQQQRSGFPGLHSAISQSVSDICSGSNQYSLSHSGNSKSSSSSSATAPATAIMHRLSRENRFWCKMRVFPPQRFSSGAGCGAQRCSRRP